jgi:hypothetical protein
MTSQISNQFSSIRYNNLAAGNTKYSDALSVEIHQIVINLLIHNALPSDLK